MLIQKAVERKHFLAQLALSLFVLELALINGGTTYNTICLYAIGPCGSKIFLFYDLESFIKHLFLQGQSR